jgi:hypothetical protein
VNERPEQIKKLIADLAEFEEKYGEYIRALEADWSMSLGAPEDESGEPEWSTDDWTRLTRKVKMLATRGGRAIKASGVAPVGSGDLPTVAFDFEVNHGYFSDDGLSVPREILERIPSQISGLEIKLEEAETAEEESSTRLFGDLVKEPRPGPTAQERPARPPRRATERLRRWWESPWVVGIGVTVIGGLIVAGIIALVSTA